MRALLQLGTACELSDLCKGGLNKGLDRGFDLSDLQKAGATVTRHKYLDQGQGARFIFLFHASMDSRHIYSLFLNDGTCKVFVVDAARNRQQLPSPANYYKEQLALHQKEQKPGVFAYPNEIEVTTSYFPAEKTALRALAKELNVLKRGPTMLLMCAPYELVHYQVKSPIFSDFPVIMSKPGKEEDSSLMWILHSSRRMVTRYLQTALLLKEQLEFASHYEVPLGVSLSLPARY